MANIFLDNLDQEKVLFFGNIENGDHIFKIIDAKMVTSKAGNDFLLVTCEHQKTGAVIDTWCNIVPKKRWLLKSLLEAVGLIKKTDKNFSLDPDVLVGHMVVGDVVNENGSYINNEGEEIKTSRPKIKIFKKTDETIPF